MYVVGEDRKLIFSSRKEAENYNNHSIRHTEHPKFWDVHDLECSNPICAHVMYEHKFLQKKQYSTIPSSMKTINFTFRQKMLIMGCSYWCVIFLGSLFIKGLNFDGIFWIYYFPALIGFLISQISVWIFRIVSEQTENSAQDKIEQIKKLFDSAHVADYRRPTPDIFDKIKEIVQ